MGRACGVLDSANLGETDYDNDSITPCYLFGLRRISRAVRPLPPVQPPVQHDVMARSRHDVMSLVSGFAGCWAVCCLAGGLWMSALYSLIGKA